jgi:hypothetical protein
MTPDLQAQIHHTAWRWAVLSSPCTASLAFTFADRLGSLLFPFGLTFRRCKIQFMLRAVVLLSLLRRYHRFSTTSHPAELDACYLVA